MDEAIKKERDKEYTFWATDGAVRILGIQFDDRHRAIADLWHEHFFWKVQSRKLIRMPESILAPSSWDKHIKWWRLEDCEFLVEWAKAKSFLSENDVAMLDDNNRKYDPNREYYAAAVTIYERTISSPYLKELSDLQLECEYLMEKIQTECFRKKDAEMAQIGFFVSRAKKAANKEIAEDATLKISQLSAEINKILELVDKMRSIILNDRS